MMTGELQGVGHRPQHGTAFVSTWIRVLEKDSMEILASALDAHRTTP